MIVSAACVSAAKNREVCAIQIDSILLFVVCLLCVHCIRNMVHCVEQCFMCAISRINAQWHQMTVYQFYYLFISLPCTQCGNGVSIARRTHFSSPVRFDFIYLYFFFIRPNPGKIESKCKQIRHIFDAFGRTGSSISYNLKEFLFFFCSEYLSSPCHKNKRNRKKNLLHTAIPMNFDIFLVCALSSSVVVVLGVPWRFQFWGFFPRCDCVRRVRFHYGFWNWISYRKKKLAYFFFMFKLLAWFDVGERQGRLPDS